MAIFNEIFMFNDIFTLYIQWICARLPSNKFVAKVKGLKSQGFMNFFLKVQIYQPHHYSHMRYGHRLPSPF